VPFDGGRLFVAGPPALGGVTMAQMWQMLVTDSRYRDAPAEERLHLLAEVTRRALDERQKLVRANGDAAIVAEQMLSAEHARSLMLNYDPASATPVSAFQARPEDTQENPSGTGFIVVDGTGLAVACNVTLYNPFGTGRLVPGIGIFLAQAPGLGTRNPYSLSPVIVTGPKEGIFRFAAAGAGGGAVPPAIVNVAARTLLADLPLADAMNGGRVYASPSSASVVVEASETPPRVETLVRRGYDVHRLDALARLNVVYCKNGLPDGSPKDAGCTAAADGGREGLGSTFIMQMN